MVLLSARRVQTDLPKSRRRILKLSMCDRLWCHWIVRLCLFSRMVFFTRRRRDVNCFFPRVNVEKPKARLVVFLLLMVVVAVVVHDEAACWPCAGLEAKLQILGL